MRKKIILGAVLLLMLTACDLQKGPQLELKDESLTLGLYETVHLSDLKQALTDESQTLKNLSWSYCLDDECYSLKKFQKIVAKEYQTQFDKDEIPVVDAMSLKICEPRSLKGRHCVDLEIDAKKKHKDQKVYSYEGEVLEKDGDYYRIKNLGESNELEVIQSTYLFGEYVETNREKITFDLNDSMIVYDGDEILLPETHESLEEDGFITIPDSEAHRIDVLVNRQRRLSENFEPDWVYIDEKYAVGPGYRVQKDAAKAFMALADAVEEAIGKRVYVTSSYRTYDYQKKLYEGYIEAHGLEEANRFSAQPGASEHQTGLALDLVGENGDMDNFGETEESDWVHANAHRFGFIVRYPKGKESITGYMEEAWHLRYVGEEIAHEIYKRGITLEEYYN